MPPKRSIAANSLKRTISEATTADSSPERPAKKAAVFSIFNGAAGQPSSVITWHPALGQPPTCQHGTYLSPPSRPKVAAFDLDGTLITPKSGMRFPKDHLDWKWWDVKVVSKVRQAHEDGFSVIILSNQSQANKKAATGSASIAEWKKKIGLVASALGDVPFRILAANGKDAFRKPMTGMWDALEDVLKKDGVDIDVTSSFYVGDAAGRPRDHSSVDRKLAENVGIRFYVPEDYFNNKPQHLPPLKGFHPRTLPAHLPLFTPSSTPLLPSPLTPEIVLFVGPPSAGKTTFFRKHFAAFQYQHVIQDILKTKTKCLNAVEQLIKEGQAAVVDNTNRDRKTRQDYVALAAKLKVPIRCLQFNISVALAFHNNLYRTFCLPADHPDYRKREFIPYQAYAGFANQMEEPDMDEGFSEIRKVNWTFEGNDEERKRWNRWLEI